MLEPTLHFYIPFTFLWFRTAMSLLRSTAVWRLSCSITSDDGTRRTLNASSIHIDCVAGEYTGSQSRIVVCVSSCGATIVAFCRTISDPVEDGQWNRKTARAGKT
jgi:hypothetical protein